MSEVSSRTGVFTAIIFRKPFEMKSAEQADLESPLLSAGDDANGNAVVSKTSPEYGAQRGQEHSPFDDLKFALSFKQSGVARQL